MRDGFDTKETWPFECQCCWHVWEEEYFVRHITDDHGNEVEVWLRSGLPVQPPNSDRSCPKCGSVQITTFPSGYLARSAEPVVPAPREVAQDTGLKFTWRAPIL
ncbi:hypothetical protein [Nonomuraea africana]|uniref:C2H2-type domain-containing protein n=1 Tax=Nonomuraea africana TaxID=46171 RepID=A0ABR9K9S0_9ACTN|nr:hypothetical protein [Nonomuraea africana]MBE1558536.1 hypothetical protein [Nonomuraea africana]